MIAVIYCNFAISVPAFTSCSLIEFILCCLYSLILSYCKCYIFYNCLPSYIIVLFNYFQFTTSLGEQVIATVLYLTTFILTSWIILFLQPALILNLEVCGPNSNGKIRYCFQNISDRCEVQFKHLPSASVIGISHSDKCE